MKTFYLLRHEDVHGNSGCGVVAEGCIFDNGMGALTWLTQNATMTMFVKISDIKKLHGHGGKTEVIVDGTDTRWAECKAIVRERKRKAKEEAKNEKD